MPNSSAGPENGPAVTSARATALGSSSILLWATLAVMAVGSAPTPPFLLTGLSLTVAAVAGLIWAWAAGQLAQLREIPWRVYAFGIAGIFGYHAFYFTALRLAPAAEASLLNYLWPILIVLGSSLLPGEKLRPAVLLGAAISLCGAAYLLLASGDARTISFNLGHLCALLAAVTWASYSLISRRLVGTPTAAVAIYCLGAAVLSFVSHAAFEASYWPETTTIWIFILLLGLGPAGLSYFTWDIGVKLGNIQLLGTASYMTPLLSTGALIAMGQAEASWALLISTLLIAGGAILAARTSS